MAIPYSAGKGRTDKPPVTTGLAKDGGKRQTRAIIVAQMNEEIGGCVLSRKKRRKTRKKIAPKIKQIHKFLTSHETTCDGIPPLTLH